MTPPTEYDLRLRVGDRKGPYTVLKVECLESDFGQTFAFTLRAAGGEIGHFRAVSPAMMRSVFEEQPREGDLVEFTRLNNKPSPFGGSTTGPKVEAVRVLERGGGVPILPSSVG